MDEAKAIFKKRTDARTSPKLQKWESCQVAVKTKRQNFQDNSEKGMLQRLNRRAGRMEKTWSDLVKNLKESGKRETQKEKEAKEKVLTLGRNRVINSIR
jgi:hypothetical protein